MILCVLSTVNYLRPNFERKAKSQNSRLYGLCPIIKPERMIKKMFSFFDLDILVNLVVHRSYVPMETSAGPFLMMGHAIYFCSQILPGLVPTDATSG